MAISAMGLFILGTQSEGSPLARGHPFPVFEDTVEGGEVLEAGLVGGGLDGGIGAGKEEFLSAVEAQVVNICQSAHAGDLPEKAGEAPRADGEFFGGGFEGVGVAGLKVQLCDVATHPAAEFALAKSLRERNTGLDLHVGESVKFHKEKPDLGLHIVYPPELLTGFFRQAIPDDLGEFCREAAVTPEANSVIGGISGILRSGRFVMRGKGNDPHGQPDRRGCVHDARAAAGNQQNIADRDFKWFCSDLPGAGTGNHIAEFLMAVLWELEGSSR